MPSWRSGLTDDEFILTHVGFLPEEWTSEMESEWSIILALDWRDWTHNGKC
jgi:hypothetical protein